ncbi:PREDICTED: ATP synthase subunit O, mitochondrial-like [Lupinus angustifolius]|uniref:ATP synthase subunit O, mitochondrial-like n=1 Tax=Lupinus angustifolius TaxID=3871 RepID=UPI00092EA299|nr:PREDICTED: ATP synthase subunit O, mitochondrial-like [Lupinus angustifolius]XP_019437106.1 PREDICTED: ATP synthase subunit O, mitochondrial-like [Lupinus angustifolius]
MKKTPKGYVCGLGNYASTLYIAVVKANSVEKVEAEVVAFVEAIKNNAKISHFTKDPSIAKEIRVKAIQKICGEAKFSDATINFIVIFAENLRLKNIDTVAKRFVELSMAFKVEVKASVTTVFPLP